jgi:hypothetical protein
MDNKYKGRACEAQPVQQFYFNADSTGALQLKQLIHLAQWLHDECHHTQANSKTIIHEFFKKSYGMRGGQL